MRIIFIAVSALLLFMPQLGLSGTITDEGKSVICKKQADNVAFHVENRVGGWWDLKSEFAIVSFSDTTRTFDFEINGDCSWTVSGEFTIENLGTYPFNLTKDKHLKTLLDIIL